MFTGDFTGYYNTYLDSVIFKKVVIGSSFLASTNN